MFFDNLISLFLLYSVMIAFAIYFRKL